MIDKAHVLEHCSFASGGSGGLGFSGWDSESPELACVRKVDDKGKTAKSFIDCNSSAASQITIEITLKNGSKTKAVIDL